MSNDNEELKEYLATLGNNVDNFILNDIEAAYLAGSNKALDKAAEVAKKAIREEKYTGHSRNEVTEGFNRACEEIAESIMELKEK